MARVNKIQRDIKTPARSSDRQTLGQRIRWLRAKSKPYMTIRQLATLSGVDEDHLAYIELGDTRFINIELNTLRRIARALDCHVFINLKRRPSPLSEECLPLGHDLPPPPKLKRKWTERGHRLAEQYGSYPWKNYRRKKRRKSPKSTSDKSDSDAVQVVDNEMSRDVAE